ncbi:MAG: gamma-glutamyl-gamma-aminobutyrate hydrolase family protein [Flavobacteriales bacterium]|nr:gamma-glutamyl-gamma-aminobutyrate hydrolase family protein [Flavobacteriales bacterium]MDW8409745.1 gamma-glutamyl-gamma-aminobutyrate hydrolase family protein [Flavobacteriales bacterium]
MTQIKIGITYTTSRLDYYIDWIAQGVQGAEPQVLGPDCQPKNVVESLHALVLTGGVDIFPSFYGGPIHYPGAPEAFLPDRDLIEMELYFRARRRGIPVLAICRGVQLVAVAEGAPLIQDLTSQGFQDHGRRTDGSDSEHLVRVDGSRFFDSQSEIWVNSAHHQALRQAPAGFKITGWSVPDEVPEILESIYEEPFFLGVQWHPERSHLKSEKFHAASLKTLRFFREAIQRFAR